ncbi:hypothetical protein I79_002092 [Cricetulus griseus]|uniref:Uncharacterized protein n=1 Tax=Cricetulus griseus TaxID=10029 RepID=G3GWG8_CRIGR|nr:hypothetical protein I79_002092 [Cricetulus griseus]
MYHKIALGLRHRHIRGGCQCTMYSATRGNIRFTFFKKVMDEPALGLKINYN